MFRYNITSQGLRNKLLDAYIVSYPKSGRTWIRTFLFKYYSLIEGEEFSFDNSSYDFMPRLYFTHDIWENKVAWSFWDRVRGKGLVPKGEENHKPIILIARDPRDVVVSLFFHMQKRLKNKRALNMDLSEFVRDGKFGVEMIIGIMNQWWNDWSPAENFHLFRYEDLRQNPEALFYRLLSILDVKDVNDNAFCEALEFSKFDNIKKLEAKGAFNITELSAMDKKDVDSFKARRGVVGGYKDYFTNNDLEFVNNSLRALNGAYGY